MRKCVHIVTTLELGGAQQNTVFTAGNLRNFEGILIAGNEGIIKAGGITTYRVSALARKINPVKDIIALFGIFVLLRKIKPEIVHTHSSKAGILGRWAAFFAGVPVIIHTFHGFGFNDWQRPFTKKLFIFAEKITAKISTHLLAVSVKNVEKAVALEICKNQKISLMHSGIDVKKLESRPTPNKARECFGISPSVPVCGMVACFKPQKSPLDFVETAKRLLKIYPEMRFILVGDGVLRREIEKRLHKYRIADSFILTGWRKDPENILPAFDVNVLTSLWEGLPRVILEAGVCMIPSVVSEVDGNCEIITDNVSGFLVRPRDIGGFVEKIDYLFKNPDVARVFAHKLRKKIIGDFDIRNMVCLIERKYEELLSAAE